MLRAGGGTWTASFGLFDWVVDAVADRVTDPAVAATLREITEHGLGYLDPAELGAAGEAEVLAIIPTLPDVAERELPASPGRADVLAHVRELADLVRPGPG